MAGKRRGNLEGSVRHRSCGSWQITVMDGYHPDGRRRTRSFSGPTLAAAKKKFAQYQRDKEDGLALDKDYTLAEFAPRFMENHRGAIKPSTYEGYCYTLRHILKCFGERKLSSIKVMDVNAFVQSLRSEGYSDSTVAQCRGLLFMLLDAAEANDLIRKNPARYADKLRRRPSPEKEVYTSDEVQKLMTCLPDTPIGWCIRVMVGTGLRSGEMCAVEPRHIAEDGSFIVVEQASSRVKGTAVLSTTKTKRSNRVVPVCEAVRPYAIALRNTNTRFVLLGRTADSLISPTAFRKAYKLAIESVPGMPYRSPHCLRHTFVSLMQSAGVPETTTARLCGHESVSTTQGYLHIYQHVNEEAVAKLSALISEGE